jgi:Uma2 family endonuclease
MLWPTPLPAARIITSIPWVVIEILSPDDRMRQELERVRDYKSTGVRHVVFLDPEACLAFRFQDGSLLQARFTSLELPIGALPCDSEALVQQLEDEQA